MSSLTLPALFVSHGSPMIALEPGAAGAFLARLGPAIDATFGRPRAIVALSAHTLTREPVLLAAPRHEAIHDFGGFDPRLYEMRYDADGAPALAERVAALLRQCDIAMHRVEQGGLDHGIWTPLRYAYPGADIPILPLGWSPRDSPARLFALGEALAPLATEGILVLGTGSMTHNLRRVAQAGFHVQSIRPEIPESAAFRAWFMDRAAARDWEALFDYRARAPHAADMHPTDEHLLPWFIAAGAGGREATPVRLHDSVTHGVLGMDAYAFGTGAADLAPELIEP
ncbi:MAG: dioxygenase [Aquincola sp.]|nr:dioxygenase [Aquincola sp.]MDH4290785.1 dioxygenase [Aquincola sp.]